MSDHAAYVYCERCEGNHRVEVGACGPDIEPRKAYDISSDDEGSTYRVAIFSRATVEAAYGAVTSDNVETVIARLTGWAASYSGPGRGFAHDPSLTLRGRNIVIRQFCGLDI